MLSLFPFLLSYGYFAPTILRIALAATLGYSAWKDLEADTTRVRFLGIAETLAAALIFVGLWTQAAALLSAIITGKWYFSPRNTYSTSTILLTFAISISLIVMGAGRLGFDLPF